MLRQRYGKIVNISSIYGFTGNATRSSYAAAKAGVAAFTKSLALEMVNDGINVNAVAPGPVWTPLIPATIPAASTQPRRAGCGWSGNSSRIGRYAGRRTWSAAR